MWRFLTDKTYLWKNRPNEDTKYEKKLHVQSVFHMFYSYLQTEYIPDWPNYILVGPKLPNRKSSLLPLNMDQFEKILYIQKIILIHSVTTTTYYITSSVCLLRISAALCLAWKQKKTFDQIYKNLFVNSSKRQSQELDFRRWKHNSKVVYFWQWRNFFFMPLIFILSFLILLFWLLYLNLWP